MTARIGRIGDHGIVATQVAQGYGRIGSITTDGAHIGLLRAKELYNLFVSHTLDLVDVFCALVIAIDLSRLIGMPLGVTSHKVRVLHTAHGLAGRILAGD